MFNVLNFFRDEAQERLCQVSPVKTGQIAEIDSQGVHADFVIRTYVATLPGYGDVQQRHELVLARPQRFVEKLKLFARALVDDDSTLEYGREISAYHLTTKPDGSGFILGDNAKTSTRYALVPNHQRLGL